MRSLIGFNNYVLGQTSLYAGRSEANMPVTNIQDETGSPSVAWQTPAGILTWENGGGAFIEIRPPLLAQPWRVLGVFRTNLTAASTVIVNLVLNGSIVWAKAVSGPEVGYGQVVIVTPSDITADFAQILFTDTTNPDGFINVPLVFAGPAWMLLTAASYETTEGADSSVDETTSRGGQEYPVFQWQRRRYELALQGIRQTEVRSGLVPLDQTARHGNNILYVPDVDSETSLKQEACYGRVTATADIGFPYGGSDRRSWRARITERI